MRLLHPLHPKSREVKWGKAPGRNGAAWYQLASSSMKTFSQAPKLSEDKERCVG